MEYSTTVSTNEPIAITIGNFDGVHRGHQLLMHELAVMAQELNCKPVLVTFSPHTLLVVRPNIDLQCLTTLEEKLALSKRYGHIDDSIVISFTREVAGLSAFDFMESLRTRFLIKGIVVGENFKLGHHRTGDVAFLEEYGKKHEIALRAVRLEEANSVHINSTWIRSLLSAGRIVEANELLGHPFPISGTVVHGDGRGKLLGFPTANLLPEPHKLWPINGIYVARVQVENEAAGDFTSAFTVYNGVVSIGVRPTFNGQRRLTEAYLLDVQRDLYDKRITVNLIERLRDEVKFGSVEALKDQMAIDVQQAREILGRDTPAYYEEGE